MKEKQPEPLVSVIMSVFNSDLFVRDSIDSIRGQTYPNWELIIVDDGSSDGTGSILKSYQDPRIKVLRHEINLGQSAGLNAAIRVAGGKYLAVQDADDISSPKRLSSQVRFMEDNLEVGAIGGLMVYRDERPGGATDGEIPMHTVGVDIERELLWGATLAHPTVMMRACTLARLRFPYDEGIRDANDYELWCRLSRVAPIANLDEVLVQYRRHPGQISVARVKHQSKVSLTIQLRFLYQSTARMRFPASDLFRALRILLMNYLIYRVRFGSPVERSLRRPARSIGLWLVTLRHG